MNQHKHILIVAGEASGDMHAAHLVRQLKAQHPHIEISAFGGPALQAAGARLLFDLTQFAVVGFFEVAKHFFNIRRIFKMIVRYLQSNHPDLLILVDYPGFNLRLAKKAKQYNIKVLYYISPQIWAWKKNRIETIRRYVDKMAVIFPFELDLYQQHQVPAAFVGHPLVDMAHSPLTAEQAKERLGLSKHNIIIALMPGSRLGEIKRLLPPFLDAATLLQQAHPGIQFILPLAPTLQEANIKSYLQHTSVNVRIIKEATYESIRAAHVVITASGTATLEIALLGTPMVITYKLAAATYWLAKLCVHIERIGLCNIVAGKTIVPELIQQAADPKGICAAVERYLQQPDYAHTVSADLKNLRDQLNSPQKQTLSTVVLDVMNEGKLNAPALDL